MGNAGSAEDPQRAWLWIIVMDQGRSEVCFVCPAMPHSDGSKRAGKKVGSNKRWHICGIHRAAFVLRRDGGAITPTRLERRMDEYQRKTG
jgi:hypothetical protein